MSKIRIHARATVLVILLFILAALAFWQVTTTETRVLQLEHLLTNIQENSLMPPEPLHNEWVQADGSKVIVRTSQQDGESVEDWVARHCLKVRLMKEAFPPAGS